MMDSFPSGTEDDHGHDRTGSNTIDNRVMTDTSQVSRHGLVVSMLKCVFIKKASKILL